MKKKPVKKPKDPVQEIREALRGEVDPKKQYNGEEFKEYGDGRNERKKD